MHLLQLYKIFPFREDLGEFMSESVWKDWPTNSLPQCNSSDPLAGTLLDDPQLEAQQWVLALHLYLSWPQRTDAALLARELDLDAVAAQSALLKVQEAVALHTDFYTKLAKNLGSCVRCG